VYFCSLVYSSVPSALIWEEKLMLLAAIVTDHDSPIEAFIAR
jgi:hypothetical protein